MIKAEEGEGDKAEEGRMIKVEEEELIAAGGGGGQGEWIEVSKLLAQGVSSLVF